MSSNRKYAAGIIADFEGMTASAMRAASIKMMSDLVTYTHKDSGQAAFNWKFSINSKYQRQRLLNRIGSAPVGPKGSRGQTSDAIIKFKTDEIKAAMKAVPAKSLKSVMLYHPLNIGWRYTVNAQLEQAMVMASNEGSLNTAMADAIRNYKRGN